MNDPQNSLNVLLEGPTITLLGRVPGRVFYFFTSARPHPGGRVDLYSGLRFEVPETGPVSIDWIWGMPAAPGTLPRTNTSITYFLAEGKAGKLPQLAEVLTDCKVRLHVEHLDSCVEVLRKARKHVEPSRNTNTWGYTPTVRTVAQATNLQQVPKQTTLQEKEHMDTYSDVPRKQLVKAATSASNAMGVTYSYYFTGVRLTFSGFAVPGIKIALFADGATRISQHDDILGALSTDWRPVTHSIGEWSAWEATEIAQTLISSRERGAVYYSSGTSYAEAMARLKGDPELTPSPERSTDLAGTNRPLPLHTPLTLKNLDPIPGLSRTPYYYFTKSWLAESRVWYEGLVVWEGPDGTLTVELQGPIAPASGKAWEIVSSADVSLFSATPAEMDRLVEAFRSCEPNTSVKSLSGAYGSVIADLKAKLSDAEHTLTLSEAECADADLYIQELRYETADLKDECVVLKRELKDSDETLNAVMRDRDDADRRRLGFKDQNTAYKQANQLLRKHKSELQCEVATLKREAKERLTAREVPNLEPRKSRVRNLLTKLFRKERPIKAYAPDPLA